MAKGFKETAAELLMQDAEQPQEKPKATPKKTAAGDPVAMFDKMTPEQKAELVKHIKETSQYDSTGTEKRTQKLTLSLRPSLVKRARETASARHYRSLTDFLEEAITEKIERKY